MIEAVKHAHMNVHVVVVEQSFQNLPNGIIISALHLEPQRHPLLISFGP